MQSSLGKVEVTTVQFLALEVATICSRAGLCRRLEAELPKEHCSKFAIKI